MITISDAEKIIKTVLPETTIIVSSAEYEGDYLFIVNNEADELEGNMDPFFKVNIATEEFSDFSPMDYPDPQAVFAKLGF